jgi:hypothetical protein
MVSACVPYGQNQAVEGGVNINSATCKTGDGDVNTYQIVGVWKKDVDKTDQEEVDNYAEGNYKLLYVVDGVPDGQKGLEGGKAGNVDIFYSNAICEKIVSGGTTPSNREVKITKVGLYFSGNKRIATNILDATDTEADPVETIYIDYRFSGSCSKTKLYLSKGLLGGKPESYTFFASNPPSNSCQ